MSHLKRIKIKTLHHPEYRQTERLRLLNKRVGTFKAEQACLMKYFPKHYKKLKTEISMGEWSLISKLRQIKTIDHFICPRVSDFPKTKATKALSILEQKIFRNKRKSAKSVPRLATNISFVGVKERPPQLSRFCPMITNLNLMKIKCLNLNRKEVGFMNRARERKILKCYNYFWRSLRSVKHLELSNKTRYSWFLIREMNSSSLFLSNLKTLKLSFILPIDEMKLVHPRNVLKELAKNEYFLKHVTHLDCEKFEGFQHYDEFVCGVLVQCSNLVSLNFPIGREAHRYSSPHEIYKECEETEALEQIQKMENLQELTISVYGIKTFAKVFSPPKKSLQKIVLNVFHSFYDPSLLDLFDSEFFERWRELSQLQILKIKMRRIAKSNDLLHKFVLPLLQMTPTLRRFRLTLAHSPAYSFSACEALDLSLFHETVANMKQLESFKVSNHAMSPHYRSQTVENTIIFDPKKCQFLSNLKKINIMGEFSEKFDFHQLSCRKKLKISTFGFHSVEALCECVKAANRVSKGLNLDLKIMLMTENLEEISSSLKVPILLERNISVDLNICWKPTDWGIDAATIIKQNMDSLGRIFPNFDVKITLVY